MRNKKTYHKSQGKQQGKQKKVVLYTSPGCKWCGTAKKHLKKHSISFQVVDISEDPQAEFDCKRNGCKGTPVYLIGSQWICGFDQKRVEKLLNI